MRSLWKGNVFSHVCLFTGGPLVIGHMGALVSLPYHMGTSLGPIGKWLAFVYNLYYEKSEIYCQPLNNVPGFVRLLRQILAQYDL